MVAENPFEQAVKDVTDTPFVQTVSERAAELAQEKPATGWADPRREGGEVVDLFVEHDGTSSPVDHPDPAEVERFIKALTPADIRYEMLVTTGDCARMLGVTTHTLRNWRINMMNLPFYKKGAQGGGQQVFYRVGDIIRYREFVLARVSPSVVMLPPPGVMGVPGGPLVPPAPSAPEPQQAPATELPPLPPPKG